MSQEGAVVSELARTISTNAERMPFEGGAVRRDEQIRAAGLVKGLNRDLGPRELQSTMCSLGRLTPDMNPASDEFAETLKKLMALPRYGTVEEIAGMASPEAGFITGANLMIDGGFSA